MHRSHGTRQLVQLILYKSSSHAWGYYTSPPGGHMHGGYYTRPPGEHMHGGYEMCHTCSVQTLIKHNHIVHLFATITESGYP